MSDFYQQLESTLSGAGLFTNGVENHGTWKRTCVASKRDNQTGALSGNSFWVSSIDHRCFVGVWGGWVYELSNPVRLAELCISWLSRVPDRTMADFDSQIKNEFKLTRLPEGEFEQLTEQAR